MPCSSRMTRAGAAAAALGAIAAGAQAGVDSLRTLAYTGGATPIPGTTYAALADPVLTEEGFTTFWARIAGPEITSANDGVWFSDRTGTLAPVVREGETFDGSTIVGIPALAMSEAYGSTLATLALSATTIGNTANLALAVSWVDNGNPTEFALIRRDVAGSNPTFTVPARPPLRFISLVDWTGATQLWRAGLSSSILGRAPVPDVLLLGGDATWRFNGFGEPGTDDLGRIVVWGSVGPNSTVPSTAAIQKTGLWHFDGESFSLLVGEGLQVSGSPAGQVWREFGARPRYHGEGVLVWGRVGGTGVTSGNDTSLMNINQAGFVTGRIDAGQQFPGAPGERFGPIPQAFSTNFIRGEAVLVVPIRNAPTETNSAVVLARESETTVLARRGDQAPGLEPGVAFDHFQKPAINNATGVAFVAQVRGAGVDSTNNRALFAMNNAGDFVPVVRTGDRYTLPDGSTKTIRRITFQEESTLLGRTAYSAAGQIVFALEFTDNAEAVVLAGIDCPSDFNDDGGIDADDIIDFFAAWDAGINADLDHSGSVDGDDVIYFFARFDAGC